MTSITSSSEFSTAPWLKNLRQTPCPAVLLLSLGVAAWLLLMQLSAVQFMPAMDVGGWLGLLLLAWGAGLWLVLLPLWALWMPTQLLDGPSVASPWRGSVLAKAGLLLAALVLWVGVWGLAPIYAAFGVFVLLVLMAVRAGMVRLNLRHGLFIFAHDALEMLMWALWGSLPWLAWRAGGQSVSVQTVQSLAWVPLLSGALVVGLAHVPAVLQPRMRILLCLMAVVLGVAWLSRPAVFGRWANGMLGLSVQNTPVTLVLTDAGCNAANNALDKRVCWYDPIARQGMVRNARIVSHHGEQVVVQMNHALRKNCLTDEQVQATVWKRMVLRRSELIAWAQDFDPSGSACAEGLRD